MKHSRTGIIISGSIFFLITVFISSCHSDKQGKAQAVIDSISAHLVPDKREGLCSVRADFTKNGTIVLKGETTSQRAGSEISAALRMVGFSVLDSIALLPDTLKLHEFRGLVTLSVINLRKLPAHSSELVSQAIMGTPVLILKSEGSWILIQTPDDYIAWTERSSVVALSTAGLNQWKRTSRVIFLDNSGWIYETPGKNDVISDLVAGCILVKTGESKGYAMVVLPDGREGYIENKSLADFRSINNEIIATGDNIVNIASKYMGLPYLWGGTSSKGVDCSGFVRSVFLMNGLILTRDASLQALHGRTVDITKGFDNLEKGDLLFFGSKGADGPRVTHVAISLGKSRFIHASSRVMINSLDSTRADFSGFRKKSLLSAKRILGADYDNGIVPLLKHEWY
jgi:hypothetical protein